MMRCREYREQTIAHLTEVLFALVPLVNGHSKNNFIDFGRYFGEVNHQSFIITAVAVTSGEIVVSSFYCTVGRKLVVVKNEELVLRKFLVLTQHKC